MASPVAEVKDGKIVNQTNTTQKTTKSNGMDKESFLQLLVAQMKYQDPLEPTSNTEYISQYAQFSQVESLQSMSSNMDLQRASNLVGKEVYIETTGTDGETKTVQGRVDYVTYKNGKAYVYVNEKEYSLDDVKTVLDSDYTEACSLAYNFIAALNKLPSLEDLDLSSEETVTALYEVYNKMTSYQKTFIASEKVNLLQKYADKIAELKKAAEEKNNTTEDKTDDKTEEKTEAPADKTEE